ncbi:recombinase RecT [Alicyclobacillus sp. ALC3]|uniref:recombinase RecT n=1 Tax=Alicyclobacillus sp. ALC3 TaxID=2796143 RepID=UPI002378F4A7|nr:recombinase RecT [Alicyclobacillus sp. ALC3]WDL97832.1 recombinase RecT [Alicyclobacillus sp. ALC3]
MSVQLEKKRLPASEAFTVKVMSEFGSGVGELALTNFQKRLVGNYFIALDSALKMAEEKRMKKYENKRDPVPVTWENVNMQKLARDVVACARVGFDPAQKNHINMVPFKNNTTGKYDITFVEGYRGIELKATKYGLNVPDAVIVEVVYSTDEFRSIKKDSTNKYEGYEFRITNDFDRGDIKGGFYYHVYSQAPEKNRLVVLSLKDIMKRKPTYASTEFWGGEKDVWERDPDTGKNRKTGTETVEGWYEKMVWKTIYRAAYGDITIDSQKIDDDYLRLSQLEGDAEQARVNEEIAENANRQTIDIDYGVSDENSAASQTELNLDDTPQPVEAGVPF